VSELPNNSAETGALQAGVIWITGYSGAGKTTVARGVVSLLREHGQHVIFLDGDHLRSIFAGRWGYEKADRIELAHVYFRLCSHLASQGYVVVIAAVAMYADVQTWVRSYIARSQVVYLDVPREVRLQRDSRTKHVYDSGTDLENMYEAPTEPDLRVANFGDTSASDAVSEIVQAFLAQDDTGEADRGKSDFWDSYYGSSAGAQQPSPFALAVADRIPEGSDVLDVGCGDGRDAVHLSSLRHTVVGLDASAAAVELCQRLHEGSTATFVHGVVSDHAASWQQRFDVLYSRFVIHAMTEQEELALWREAGRVLRPGAQLMAECRSINDPLAREGVVLSPTERIAGHYRRFIVLDDLVRRLEGAGFVVETAMESNGLAVHGDEDPVVIRLYARNG